MTSNSAFTGIAAPSWLNTDQREPVYHTPTWWPLNKPWPALWVTCGRAQRWGGAIEEIHPGDVVWIPPGEKHWHGATATTGMTHIAIQEKIDGKAVDWMEKVSDEQYQS